MDFSSDVYRGYEAEYPLHVAAQKGNIVTVNQLIAEGSCINQYTFDSVTPLHEACLAGQLECVQLLIAAGANIEARNVDGATPLCDACSKGNPIIVSLLLQHGAKVNPALNFTSPLHEAVLSDKCETISILVDAGANLEQNDLHFGTPLHVAAFKDHIKSARILLLAGSDVNAAKTHQMALHLSCINNSIDMAALLLEFGARVYAETQWGTRPSQIVSCRSLLHKLLKKYEGNVWSVQECCRMVIRKSITPRRLAMINTLPLPKYLIYYLKYVT